MHPLNFLRMLPPGGAPLPLLAIARALADSFRPNSAFAALHATLAKKFAQKHLFFTSSGRGALALLFAAMHRANPDRNQILLPAYLSFSVPSAVVRAGCRIALYDVAPESLTPDMTSLKAAISEQTLAVVAAHQFGLPFDLAPMADLCREHGAFLVDDAAQVMGATIEGKRAGASGDAGIFSLSRGKPICAVEGGILFTNNDGLADSIHAVMADSALANRLQLAKTNIYTVLAKAVALSLCRRPEIYKLPASLPWLKIGESIFDPSFGLADFTGFQASLAVQSYEKIESINYQRLQKASTYIREIATIPLARPIVVQAGANPIYLRFPVIPATDLFGEMFGEALRDAQAPKNFASLHEALAQTPAANLGLSPGFPLALCDIPELLPHVAPTRPCPGARFLAHNLITLPTHDQVLATDALRAVGCLKNALEALHTVNASNHVQYKIFQGKPV